MYLHHKKWVSFLVLLIAGIVNIFASPSYAGDKVNFSPHASIFPQEPSWKEPELSYHILLGGYEFSHTIISNIDNDYTHVPFGPIMASWTITRFLGEKIPDRKYCDKEPKYPSLFGQSKSEYDKAILAFTQPFNTYIQCRRDLFRQFEDEETHSHYYARSTNNYKLVMTPYKQFKNRNSYSRYYINAAFGDVGGMSERVLTEKQMREKDQFLPWPCTWNKETECYRLSDNVDSFFYKIDQPVKKKKNDFHTAHTAAPLSLTDSEFKINEIKGIEINDAQKAYLFERCKQGYFNCYLDDNTPNLTEKQKAYIIATTWDMDTNKEARKALKNKSKGSIYDQ